MMSGTSLVQRSCGMCESISSAVSWRSRRPGVGGRQGKVGAEACRIIGLSDGLTVPFALTAGLSSLGSSKLVVTGGLAELCAGAISMGLGGYRESGSCNVPSTIPYL